MGPRYEVELLLQKAQTMIDQCQPELALKFYEKALTQAPDNVDVLDSMGELYMEFQCPQEAYTVLKKSTDLAPDINAQKWLNLSQIVEGSDAEKYAEKAIQLLQLEYDEVAKNQNIAEMKIIKKQICAAFCSLAELYMTDLCYADEAEHQCEMYMQKAMEYDVGSPEVTQAYANLRLTQRQLEDAKKYMQMTYDRLTACDENDRPSLDFRIFSGKLLIEVQLFEAAADVLEGVMLEDDENAELWFLVGQCYMAEQDYASAVDFFQKCHEMLTQLKTDDPEAFALQDQLDHVQSLWQKARAHVQPSEPVDLDASS